MVLADYFEGKSPCLDDFCLVIELQTLSKVVVRIKAAGDKEGHSLCRSLVFSKRVTGACLAQHLLTFRALRATATLSMNI